MIGKMTNSANVALRQGMRNWPEPDGAIIMCNRPFGVKLKNTMPRHGPNAGPIRNTIWNVVSIWMATNISTSGNAWIFAMAPNLWPSRSQTTIIAFGIGVCTPQSPPNGGTSLMSAILSMWPRGNKIREKINDFFMVKIF